MENGSIEQMQKNAGRAAASLKLLANAKRLIIMCHLVKGPKSVGELSALVGLSQSAISQHLSKMRSQKMVSSQRSGQMIYYAISNPEIQALLATLYLIYCR